MRIGVSVSDPDGILATPVETVRRDRGGAHLRRLATFGQRDGGASRSSSACRVPLSDRAGSSADDAVAFADALAARISLVPVRLADERLTTVGAARPCAKQESRAREQRAMIDQAAAVAILQGWLDQRRNAATTRRE